MARARRISILVDGDLYRRVALQAERHSLTVAEAVHELVDRRTPEQVCRVCGCSAHDACLDEETGEPCSLDRGRPVQRVCEE